MDKLIHELLRLYLQGAALTPEALAERMRGEAYAPLPLLSPAGLVRAIVLPFDKLKGMEDGQHWTRLCEVASLLQTRHGFPAPAVSISSSAGFRLWLSLAEAVPADEAQAFLEGLRDEAFPELALAPDAARQAVELPPCLNPASGRWAAFINPGMGASFADEPGLEMAPPAAAQAAFLEGLESVEPALFAAALARFASAPACAADAAPATLPASRSGAPSKADTLLLRDATLEDIVRHLHAKNIEPSFRHLLPPS